MSSYSSIWLGYRLVSGKLHLKVIYLDKKGDRRAKELKEEVAKPEARHWKRGSEKTSKRR